MDLPSERKAIGGRGKEVHQVHGQRQSYSCKAPWAFVWSGGVYWAGAVQRFRGQKRGKPHPRLRV